jgi:hypothetical protein
VKGDPGAKSDKGDPGASSSPAPSSFRNYTIEVGGGGGCVLARAETLTDFVITYEATDGTLTLRTDAACSGLAIVPSLIRPQRRSGNAGRRAIRIAPTSGYRQGQAHLRRGGGDECSPTSCRALVARQHPGTMGPRP